MKKHSTSKKNIQENLESKVNFKHYLNRSNENYSVFPKMRLRRLRKNEAIRDLLQETHLSIKDLVVPLFVQEGISKNMEIESMPGIFRFSLKTLLKEVEDIVALGIKAIILFGIPSKKDGFGNNAFDKDGIAQQAIKTIKDTFGEKLVVITDVCLCQYTSHGHCGIIKNNKVDNDRDFRHTCKNCFKSCDIGRRHCSTISYDGWPGENIERHSR